MLRSGYRLPFDVFGIPIKLDVTFALLLALLTWLIGARVGAYIELFDLPVAPEPLQQGLTPWLLGLASALGLVISVLIHELSHALTARRYGVEIKEITLWILGGIAQFREMPQQPRAEAVVAVVGPITSLALGGIFWSMVLLLGPAAGAALVVLSYLAAVNVVLAVFNLLPALPLDGGRVLRSLLALRMPHLKATRISAGVSQIVAILMGLFGLLSLNLFLVAIAFFVYMAVQAETRFATVTQALEDIRVTDLMTADVVTVRPSMPVPEFITFMFANKHVFYPVVEDEDRVVGVVRLQNVENADEASTIADVMSPDIATIRSRASAVEAFKRINENEGRRLIVVDEDEAMIGILSGTDLLRAVQIRLAGQELDGELLPSGRQVRSVRGGRD